MSLEVIDTSLWQTKDKAWMEARKVQWPAIEQMVGLDRKKTEVNVIKQYFLRGKMPKWEKYQNWHDIFRPLDLHLFLWLHPSNDIDILEHQYRLYIESDQINVKDIIAGYGAFIDYEILRATGLYESLDQYPFPFMGEKNIILFRIMFRNLDYVTKIINCLIVENKVLSEQVRHIFEFMGYHHFFYIRNWLLQDAKLPLMSNCLYQYDEVIEWCLTTLLTETNKATFLDDLKTKNNLQEYQKALYCFHHFDTKKEGDTCRTQFIYKIRKILDERDFILEFKQMWHDVKAGKIEVKGPWKGY